MHVANSFPWFVIFVLSLFIAGFAMQNNFRFMNLDLSLFSLTACGLCVVLRPPGGASVPSQREGVSHCARNERGRGGGLHFQLLPTPQMSRLLLKAPPVRQLPQPGHLQLHPDTLSLATQSVFCGPAAPATVRRSGPIPDLPDQNLHFNRVSLTSCAW